MSHFRVTVVVAITFCLGPLATGGGNRLLAAPVKSADPQVVYYYDLTGLSKLDCNKPAEARTFWDTLHLVSSVQGIVNRQGAVLYVRTQPFPDDFWWKYLRSPGNWLAGRPVKKIGSLKELLDLFAPQLKGLVVYSDSVGSTSNVASTVAGVEHRACLRYDASGSSVFSQVMAGRQKFVKDVRWLCKKDGSPLFSGDGKTTIPETQSPGIKSSGIRSSGSAKCDAYLWAKQRYLDAGRTSSNEMAYYLDSYWLKMPTLSSPWNCTLSNHDYYISRAAFFIDLHVWDDESPVDDPGQPLGTDVTTFKSILRSMSVRAKGRIFDVGGFTPWAWKYTSHGKAGSKHDPVPTEWETVRILSSYNACINADALGYSAMANASFYQHFPLRDRYPQPKKPTVADMKKRGLIGSGGKVVPRCYVTFYMGDYDSAAWFSHHVPRLWADPARGTIPCSWAFNPNLDQRAPHVMHYVRTKASEQDWFVAGDNGAGYLNPGMLTAPRLDRDIPDGWDAWTRYNSNYFKRYDLSATGFVIDGYAPGMGRRGLSAYRKFSPTGLIGQKIPNPGLHDGVLPTISMRMDLYGTPKDAGRTIAGLVSKDKGSPQFLPIRTILQTPSWHKATMRSAGEADRTGRVEFVDMVSFFVLLKAHLQNQ